MKINNKDKSPKNSEDIKLETVASKKKLKQEGAN